ncbi:MAG: TRAP transporter substrate-binding protein DctP [Rhodospirillaceae bacterium]
MAGAVAWCPTGLIGAGLIGADVKGTVQYRIAPVRCGLLVAGLLMVMLALPATAREFKVADSQPSSYPSVQALHQMAGTVAERTDGRHRLKIYDSGQLVHEAKSIELVRSGVIDLVRFNIATVHDLIPETRVLGLPYLFKDEAHLLRVLESSVGTAILAAFERFDMVGLTYFETSPRSFYTVHGPLRHPNDFRGLRMRVSPSTLLTAALETMDAGSIYMPYKQVMTGLSTGLIDGAENNLLGYFETGHYRVARFFSRTQTIFSPGILVMSKRVRESLSEKDWLIFRDAASEAVAGMRRHWPDREIVTGAALSAEGVEIIDNIDTAPFVAAMQPIYRRFAAESPVRDLMTRIQEIP